jgi:cobalamin biosynthetic protein CobC
MALPIPPVTDHGGNLAAARTLFGSPAQGWLDLSTGINPWAYPLPVLDPAVWSQLPGHDTLMALRVAAAACYGAGDATVVAAAPGSQALIQLLPWMFAGAGGHTAIVGPTYAEHARCWRRAGHEVLEVDSLDAAAATGADRVIVVNPNNPDGRCCPPDALLALADGLAARGGVLLVDEAFAEVAPAFSVAPAAGRPGLVVLRSFGKFFGLAGLRLGFALAEPEVVRRLMDDFGPWAVSGPAQTIATAALGDAGWIAATRVRLDEGAEALDRLLMAHGLEVAGGTSLFRLVRTPRAGALYRALGARGILVRPFAAHAGWLRIGLPPDAAAMRRLDAALGDDESDGDGQE